jgi:hypothetical protein
MSGHIYVSSTMWCFSTFSRRPSTQSWSTGMILPSFWMITVRSAVSVSSNIVFDGRLDALTKLNHAIAGLYMYVFNFIRRKTCTDVRMQNNLSWETVLTAGFELDVLRGKISYRWTIWVGFLPSITGSYHHLIEKQLYLGNRYALLFTFVIFFIIIDGPRVPCQVRL